MKQFKKIWPYLIIAVAVVAAAVIIISTASTFAPASTGEHAQANKLIDELKIVPYFKGGDMLYSSETTAAKSVYDVNSSDLVWGANYALDSASGRVVYTDTNKALYLFDGSKTVKIGENVVGFRCSGGIESIAFFSSWRDNDELGSLFLWHNGETKALDFGLLTASTRFSQDGNYLFALKPNEYPKIKNTLIRYTLSGEKKEVNDECAEIFWINDDGSTLIAGESVDDSLFSYTFYGDNFKKKIEFSNVYLSCVSDDRSVAYILYNYISGGGTLAAIDLLHLTQKEIANDVGYFAEDAVTDLSKGIVYATAGEELCDIYYAALSGSSVRLVRNTYQQALYSIALNNGNQTGYLITQGAEKEQNALYRISWKQSASPIVEKVIEGYIDSLVYYETSDTVTFLKNPAGASGELYICSRKGEPRLISKNCAAEYDAAYESYTSQSVLANDAQKLYYFTELVEGDSMLEMSGTLHLFDLTTGTDTDIAENVSSARLSLPVVDGTLSEIYYCVKTEKDLFDLYLYKNGKATLISSEVHGTVAMTE